jgi:hypothetical protein
LGNVIDLFDPNLEEDILSVYSYTTDGLYDLANSTMNNPEKRVGADGGLSDDVKAVLPWFKKVSIGLENLPASCDYTGTLYRVTRFTFHRVDFLELFQKGNTFAWHTWRSTSKSEDILRNTSFVGQHATVYEIHGAVGKCIAEISQFPDEEEVLLPLGTMFQVKEARIGTGRGDDIHKSADWIVLEMLPRGAYSLLSEDEASWM